MKNIIITALMFLLFLSPVISVCTVTFDEDSYNSGSTVTAAMVCSDTTEKSKAYVLNWTNSTGYGLQLDTGTTPSIAGTTFFKTYDLGIYYNETYGNLINATLTGLNLEGKDYANVTGIEANNLVINNAFFSAQALVGSAFAVDFEVTDSTGLMIDNSHCNIFGTDENNAPIQSCGEVHTHDGRAQCAGTLAQNTFVEGNSYLAKIRCSCGIGDEACFNELGETIEKYKGSRTYVFSISPWLSSQTLTDRSIYSITDPEVLVCANVTNTQNFRIPIEVYYSYRCGGGNNATDRILIDTHTEIRGISANTTQNQCAALEIKNLPVIQGKTNMCYASTDVRVLNVEGDQIITYPTTSKNFNITSDSNLYSEVEVNNMLPITIGLIAFALYFFVLAFLNNHFAVRFLCSALSLIEMILLMGLLYVNENSASMIGLLKINFYSMAFLGLGIGLISLFLHSVRIAVPDDKMNENAGNTWSSKTKW